MNEIVHRRQYQGRTIMHSWVGAADAVPARVHALAFTVAGELLLVGGAPGAPGAPGAAEWWLPGGGIEPGESPEEALARELREEAAATVVAWRPLGAQRVDDPGTGSELRAFYWTRVTLADEYAPAHVRTRAEPSCRTATPTCAQPRRLMSLATSDKSPFS